MLAVYNQGGRSTTDASKRNKRIKFPVKFSFFLAMNTTNISGGYCPITLFDVNNIDFGVHADNGHSKLYADQFYYIAVGLSD